jgi:signal peptidase I
MKSIRVRATIARSRRIAWNALAIFGLSVIVYRSLFHVSYMVSNSMSPTLQGIDKDNGDVVLSERITFACRDPRRWEVVAYRDREDTVVMKRVVGLPGETIQMLEGGQLVVDGKTVPRPASLASLVYRRYGNLTGSQETTCGDGFYVLGDDSVDSDDSRYNGPVAREDIFARPLAVLSPSNRRGWVQP